MLSFFDLPEDVIIMISTHWLSLKDLCRLDTSICNQKYRTQFLLTLGSKKVLFHTGKDIFISALSFKWLVLRNISVKHVTLKHNFDGTIVGEIISKSSKVFHRTQSAKLNPSSHLNDECLLLLINVCKNLIEFSLNGFKKISDNIIIAMTKNNPSLKYLNLSGCWNITDVSLNYISTKCLSLEVLDLSATFNIHDEGIINIIKQCKSLHTINLQLCSEITDESIIEISKYCRYLKNLNISSCINITNHSLQAIQMNCNHIEMIDISYNKKLTEEQILSFIHSSIGSNLKELNMEGLSKINDVIIEKISEKCLNLKLLNIKFCSLVSMNAIKMLRNKLVHLQLYV